MAFQVSPGIYSAEYDYTTRATSAITAAGAIAGVFNNGPVDVPTLITSEKELVSIFGKPSNANYETWFTAADFLAYSNALWVTRVVSSTTVNAVTTGTAVKITTAEQAIAKTNIGTLIARRPGALGNSLKISICPNAAAYKGTVNDVDGITIDIGASTATVTDYAKLAAGDILQIVDSSGKKYNLTVSDASTSTVTFKNKYTGKSSLTNASGTRLWGYVNAPDLGAPPATGRIHIAVIDEDGTISGVAGTVLETFANVSVTPGATNGLDNAYYKDQINYGYGRAKGQSAYIYATGATISTSGSAVYASLANGADGNNATEANVAFGELCAGYDNYADKNAYDIRYILQGKARSLSTESGDSNEQLANYIIDNICEVRKDCMLFVTPSSTDVNAPQMTGTNSEILDKLDDFRALLSASSYAVLDSGYKYRFDVYNNVNRWTPLNGDIAGLVARTAVDKDPWYSPAGYNRGKIKNVIKLAFNPNEAERDFLYPKDINPVISQSGEGVLLFGDKTLLGAGSAFDHINVRMLFITVEKAIERAAKASLFEFNDSFTRAQFKNIVEPYLRDVQGRRGIYDFKVICDETNNTAEIIDQNTFIGDIYIKPARSINYIKLNFVAVPTGTSFNEIVGDFQ